MIAIFICAVQLGDMVSLMAGGAGFAMVSPLALIMALVIGVWISVRRGHALKTSLSAAGLVLGLLVFSLALSAFFYDFSWDGEWYHQTGIIALARGWSPVTDPMHSFIPHLERWERHYAKGTWYFAAAVYRTTGHIELGKAINWLAAAALFLAATATGIEAGLSRRHAFAIAVVLAINPVIMSEVTTFLVDGVMVSFLVVAAASLFTCMHKPSVVAACAGVAAAIVTINAKFTGLVYLCFALAAAALWCLLKRRQWLPKFVCITGGALVLGACIWGYNPYVTNTIYRHQPFYPMLGSAKYPSLEQAGQDGNEKYETPKNMVGRSRLVRFGYSIFGRPGNQPYREGLNASLMFPFMVRPADLYAYTYHETRVAGFGPLFSGCLILACVLWVWQMIVSPADRWPLVLIPAAIIASLSLSRHLWWPRYGPQLWLLPIVPVMYAVRSQNSKARKRLAEALIVLLLVNAAIVAYVHLHWEAAASAKLRTQLHQMRDSGETYEVATFFFKDSTDVRLTEAGVRFRDVGMKAGAGSQELKSVVEGYPLAIKFRTVPSPSPTQK